MTYALLPSSQYPFLGLRHHFRSLRFQVSGSNPPTRHRIRHHFQALFLARLHRKV